uniref:Uncharacterized protein n=1 Tax=Setaria italica TaxID=4555 RepID=K3YWL5_SETIT
MPSSDDQANCHDRRLCPMTLKDSQTPPMDARTLPVCPVPLILGSAPLFPTCGNFRWTEFSDRQEARDIAREPPRATIFATAYAGGRRHLHTRTAAPNQQIDRAEGTPRGPSPPRRRWTGSHEGESAQVRRGYFGKS